MCSPRSICVHPERPIAATGQVDPKGAQKVGSRAEPAARLALLDCVMVACGDAHLCDCVLCEAPSPAPGGVCLHRELGGCVTVRLSVAQPYICVWDVNTMRELAKIEAGFFDRAVCAVGFSGNGSYVVAIGASTRALLVFGPIARGRRRRQPLGCRV
jgi:hypothetical protein